MSEQRKKRRVRVPRKITVGTPRASAPGSTLDCLLLAARQGEESADGTPEEYFGVDLGSGAFVRVVGAGRLELAATGSFALVRLTIAPEGEPADPARPELVVVSADAEPLGTVRVRRARHLLDSLVIADRPAATLLGTRGPSVAYIDLDGTTPSLVLLRAKTAAAQLIEREGQVLASLRFGGVTQVVPVIDRRVAAAVRRVAPRSLEGPALATGLGFRPGYLLIGLDAVRDGHVRKVVLGLFPRSARGRRATSAASRRPDPLPSPNQS